MEQTLARHSDQPKAGDLLRLVTAHLESPMGALTLHETNGERAEILTVLNMPGPLAARVVAAVHREIWSSNAPIDNIGLRTTSLTPQIQYLSEAQSWITRITLACQVDADISLAVSACRHGPGPYLAAQPDPGMQDWVDLSLRLLWGMQCQRKRAGMFGKALDLFDFGMLLLDRQGSIVFANDRAWQLLDARDGIRRAGASLTATDFDNAVRLQTAIQHLTHRDAGPTGSDGPSVMLLRRAKARPLVAALSRLSDAHEANAVAILHLLDPDTDTAPWVAALCRAYGLTATEASLAIRLVEGLTIEGAARDMRVQTQTARAYLKQVFAKTDTHRQADLVRVILNGVVHIRTMTHLPSNEGKALSQLRAEPAPVWG